MKSSEEEIESLSEVTFFPPLYIQRYEMVYNYLQNCENIAKIADFGCAEGKLLRRLKKLSDVQHIACIDCDEYTLEQCLYEARPLNWDMIFGRETPLTVNVFNGSVAQKDSRLKDFDAITCVELIEHLKPEVLPEMAANIFGFIAPKVVIITTPNIEYNVLFPQMKESSKLRHWDHKFEWTRRQFNDWCRSVTDKYPEYTYETTGVGNPPNHSEDIGFCTQIAIFNRKSLNNEMKSEFNFTEESADNCINYKLVGSFDYPKSTHSPKEELPTIEWDSVLN